MHTYAAQQRTTSTLAHRWTITIGTHQWVGYSEGTLVDVHLAKLAQLILLEPEQRCEKHGQSGHQLEHTGAQSSTATVSHAPEMVTMATLGLDS